MLQIIGAACLVLAAATLSGSAIWTLAGLRPRSPVAPAVGFAALLCVQSIAIRLPGHATTAVAVAAVLLLASATYLLIMRGGALAPGWALIAAGLTVVLAMLPFAVAGRAGLFGVGTNDDMAEHLLAALSLQNSSGAVSKLVVSGYPVGPHSIAASIAQVTGMPLESSFTGVLIAVPALLALAAGGILVGPRALRIAVATATGLCYLQAAYLVQASFKEPIEAVMLVAFVATLTELGRERRETLLWGVPLAVLAAGAVYVYSYAGLAWLVLWLVMRVAARRLGRVSSALGPVAVAALIFAGLVAAEVPRMVRFAHSGYNAEGPRVLGNLLHPLSPLEGLGIWPRLDFRFDVPVASVGGVLALAALAALLLCLARSVSRRDFALPAGVIVAAGLYGLSATKSPYSAAKALAVVGPLVTLTLGRELLLLLRSGHRPRWVTTGAVVLVILLAVGAYSDLEVLRDGPVGPAAHAHELVAIGRVVGRQPTLFLGDDDFVGWELRGTPVATPPSPLYAAAVVPLRAAKAWSGTTHRGQAVTTSRFAGQGLAYDFDSVPSRVLDRFTYVVLPRSPYSSEPPPNWTRVDTTRSYALWRLWGLPTPGRQTLDELGGPGAILDCTTAHGRAIASQRGYAMVRPVPVIGTRLDWKGRVGYAGASARQRLVLAPGRWDISLQYAASAGSS